MPFKFTFLGLEFSNCSSACDTNKKLESKSKMVNKKLSPQQKKFKTAQKQCHAETTTPKDFGKCMSGKLSKSKKSTSKKTSKKSSKKKTSQRSKFGKAVQSCHRTTKSKEAFGKCMSKKLKKKKSDRR